MTKKTPIEQTVHGLNVSSLMSMFVCFWMLLATPVHAKSTFDFLEPEYFVDEIFTKNQKALPKRIAILPVKNAEEEEDASELIRTLVYNHFSALSYKDVELKLVDRSLKQHFDVEQTDFHELDHQSLKDALNVDGIIKIKIHQYETVFALFASTVTVRVSLQLQDLHTGKVIWKGKQTGRSVDGGVPLDLLSAAAAIFSSSQNTGETIKQRVANEVIYELIEKLPDLPNSLAFKQPKIRFMEHNGANGPMKAGDVFQVVMKAEAGLDAFFTIDGWLREQSMQEIDKGIYQSQIQVPDSINLTRANMSVRVVDESGNQGQLFDYLGGVSIDNIPPPTPAIKDIAHADAQVKLTWSVLNESDIEKYQVYRSNKPLSGFTIIKETEFTQYQDTKLQNNRNYYYKIAAVDRAGNISPFTPRVIGHPVRKGPTSIASQTLIGEVKWYAAASPYIVEGKLTVAANARFTIEPGTKIIMQPNARISVAGQIIWNGSRQKPIRIEGEKNRPKAPSLASSKAASKQSASHTSQESEPWVGVLLNQSHMDNNIEFLHLSGSKHGLVISDARLTLRNSLFKKNATALQVINTQKIKIVQVTVEQNTKGIVFKHSYGDLKRSIIRDNQLFGMHIENAVPNLEDNHWINNQGFDVFINNAQGNIVDLNRQHWGRNQWLKVRAKIWGEVNLDNYLDRKNKLKSFSQFNWSIQLDSKQMSMPAQRLLKHGIEQFNKNHLNVSNALLTQFSKQAIDERALIRLAQIAFLRKRYQRTLDLLSPMLQAKLMAHTTATQHLDTQSLKPKAWLLKAQSEWLMNQRTKALQTLGQAIAQSNKPNQQLMLSYQLLQ